MYNHGSVQYILIHTAFRYPEEEYVLAGSSVAKVIAISESLKLLLHMAEMNHYLLLL